MALELYWISGSPFAWSAMLALEIKGLAYESRRLDPGKREQKTPEYLAMNPRGKVPMLKDGDTVICESTAILAYLESKYPEPPCSARRPRKPDISGSSSSRSGNMSAARSAKVSSRRSSGDTRRTAGTELKR